METHTHSSLSLSPSLPLSLSDSLARRVRLNDVLISRLQNVPFPGSLLINSLPPSLPPFLLFSRLRLPQAPSSRFLPP